MDKKLLVLVLFFFVTTGLFLASITLDRPLSRLTRATEEQAPSAEKSMMIAWPLDTQAGPDSKVEISVFVRSESGLPLGAKKVSLRTSLGNVSPNQSVSDKAGKAVFYLTSSQKGLAEVKAFIDEKIQLKQILSINFD